MLITEDSVLVAFNIVNKWGHILINCLNFLLGANVNNILEACL